MLVYLFAFLLYIPLAFLIGYTMVDIDPVDRNYALLYSLVTATTAIAMYIGHAERSAKRSENINLAAPYSVKNDLAAYVKLEGKHIIIVFAVLAVVCEVSVIARRREYNRRMIEKRKKAELSNKI